MEMDAELEILYVDAERLLRDESACDDIDEKCSLVESAISKATELVRRCPDDADFHHLLGLAWYHHPRKTPERLSCIRDALKRALSRNPQHQFANQYLGYTNFDEGEYAVALEHFDATGHEFFNSIDQKWRSLKAVELAFVCQLRLGHEIDDAKLRGFFDVYLAEEREEIPNTVVPLELRKCAEWLYERSGTLTDEPLHSIVEFLHASGELSRSDDSGLKHAWSQIGVPYNR